MSNHAPKVDPGAKLIFVLSAVALLGAVYILISSLINTYNKNSTKGEITASSKVEKAADNMKPIGSSATSDTPVVATSTAARPAKEVYTAVCQACHATGVADSPKLGDKAAWEPRVATGLDALMTTAINGRGAMPARGGNPSVTDDELKATVLYMLKESGFDLGGSAPAAPTKEKKPAEPKAKPATAEKKPAVEIKIVEEKANVAAPKTSKAKAKAKPDQPATPEVKAKPDQPATPKEPVAPVVSAVVAPVVAAVSAGASSEAGKKVYDAVCFVCHKTGVAGSPILGNKKAWAPRIASGRDALISAVLKGKGAMPPKGGNMSISDDDVIIAVDYMIEASK